MRYFANYDESGKLTAISTGNGSVEITESEYNELIAMILEKSALVTQLYNSEITLDDVPTEWQEEIQRRVDERIAQQGTAEDTMTEVEQKAHAHDILTGVIQ